MSLNMPSRRLLKGASAVTLSSTSSTGLLPTLQSLSLAPVTPSSARPFHSTPSRPWFWNRKSSKEDAPKSTIEKQVTGSVDTRKALQQRLQGRLQGPTIFEDEAAAAPKPLSQTTSTEDRRQQKRDPKAYTRWGGSLVAEHIARAADPDPRSRVRWERKMVIRSVRRGTDPFSVEPRKERIARTERKLLSRSPWLPTSTKKLVHLARQIQGKTVDDALVQMRYSKKKMAQEVGVQLRQARDTAIVERGMGLSLGVDNEVDEKALAMAANPVKIQTKDKKFVQVDNPTRMYVAEAWVNRGPLRGQRPSYRARGRVQVLEKPATSITVVLKEERTRIREHQERVAKKLRQGPWVHLPDRPVTAQRPYYSW